MAFRMAQPWKDPNTGMLHLRQRTPSDLVDKVRGSSILLPIGDTMVPIKIGDVVQASLRTKEPSDAKVRHAVADAALRMYWDRARKFGTQLSHKQAVALAGDFYRMMIAKIEDEPHISHHAILEATKRRRLRATVAKLGLDPEQMETLATAVGTASLPQELLVQVSDADERHPDALQTILGGMADAYLSQEHLVLDAASRTMLIRELWRAWRLVLRRAERLSDGDYGQDPNLDRFPKMADLVRQTANGVKISQQFELWRKKQENIKAASTIDRYSPSLRSFIAFVKDKDLGQITPEDVHDWAEHRRDVDGIDARTVNKNDLIALSSLLTWSTKPAGGRVVKTNVARGIMLETPFKGPRREKTFRPDEIARILKAANAATVRRPDAKLLAAKRWCPWLAAYTGARIFECTSIRGEDVMEDNGTWVVELHRTKGNRPRRVPIHEHLIELGFLDFVRASGPGPLFHDENSSRLKTHPADLRAEYLARWVRRAAGLDDLDVSPNHGWRHTFKTQLLAQGVPARISDAITGHSSHEVARTYEAPNIEMMADALRRLPRYKC